MPAASSIGSFSHPEAKASFVRSGKRRLWGFVDITSTSTPASAA